MSIEVRPGLYDHKFPYFARPEAVSEYTVTTKRQVLLGRANAKYLRPYEENGKTNFDLNQGKDTFIDKDASSERLDVLLRWACKQSEEGETRAKKIFHEADIVCWRGSLTRIGATPFSDKESWRFVALRADDVIYLCEYPTEESLAKKAAMTDRDKMMAYWGFKFEQYMTSETAGGEADTSSHVDCREEFAVTFKTRIEIPGGRGRCLRIAYGAEVDGIDANGSLVEMKTQRKALEGGFWKWKSIKWWLQSFLIGLDKITVGYRNDDGIVERVGTIGLNELAQRSTWKGNICFNFIATVLSMVEHRIPSGSPDYGSCHVRYDPISKKVYVEDAKKEETTFLTNEFIKHFNLGEPR
ncbi:hypothetical protein PFISCL1PPCAC_20041 [Pristionchus fissidentatus]|uniref:Decapping nuclease n=1 Tax=Pristionchus fissidentatus TaxID=1538716 RepID=A0AAV5W9T3_9BILA|nr:hypothetical protein PFISCL1PPCAC_20041 [Pristionchus fissidentatus]